MAWITPIECKTGIRVDVPPSEKHPDGHMTAKYYVYDRRGKKVITDGGGGYITLKLAKIAKRNFEVKLQRMKNGLVDDIDMTVEKLAQERLDYCGSIKRSPKTIEIIKRCMNLLCEFAPGKEIADITPVDAIRFKSWLLKKEYDWKRVGGKILKKEYSVNGVRHDLVSIKAAFGFAVERRYIMENPFKGILKDIPAEKVHHFLTMEEAERLLNACRFNSELVDIVLIGLYTGMRLGEILGITAEWVKPSHISIPYKETFQAKDGDPRMVPINDRIRPIIEKYLQASLRPDQRFFAGWDSDRLEKGFRRAVKRSQIVGRVRFHDLRHSFASNFLQSGGNETELAEILGHESLETTRIYSHIRKEHLVAKNNQVNYPIAVPANPRKVTMPQRKVAFKVA